ncbi:MAG: DNA/RNA non-specific endonuclease, partial [Pseudanabaena sp.]
KNGADSELKGKIAVPATMWKVILVLDDPSKGLAGVTASTRAIAVIMPNKQGRDGKWQDFYTTVDDVQKLTGYDFFSNVPPDIQKQIESKKGCYVSLLGFDNGSFESNQIGIDRTNDININLDFANFINLDIF